MHSDNSNPLLRFTKHIRQNLSTPVAIQLLGKRVFFHYLTTETPVGGQVLEAQH
jgi:hypothetical protein